MNKIELLKLNNNKENIIYSPYSLLIALSMIDDGADGVTKEELGKIIDNEEVIKLGNIENVLSILNKMYIKNNVNSIIHDDHKNVIKSNYDADIELSDLNDVGYINSYIEKNTFGQIKNMLDQITGNLLLINTLAVDMEWPYEIYGDSVRPGVFNDMQASYIYGFYKSNVSYYKDDDVTVLGLDLKEYDSNKYQSIIIQPDNMELNDYINSIDDEKLSNILNSIEPLYDDPRIISISVPKFSFDYNFKANETFAKLGLNLTTPNLSKITDINDEMKILHKANIDFSEKGIKASAATVVEMRCGAALIREERLDIKINKPFIFILREKKTNTILFMGTVYNPILWKDDEKNYTYR